MPNLFGVYAFGRDRTMINDIADDLDFASWFIQADYGLYPWLVGVLRYEAADGYQRVSRIVPNITMLPRPNIKAIFETQVNPDDAGFDLLMARLDFAF